MRVLMAIVALEVCLLHALQPEFRFGDLDGDGSEAATVEGDATSAEELDNWDNQEIDDVVEDLSSQFSSQIKQHIRAHVQAQRSGGSKLSQSRVMTVSPLHMAASNNQYEVAEKLLSQGTDPNIHNPLMMTPLHSAAEHGYKDIVDLYAHSEVEVCLPCWFGSHLHDAHRLLYYNASIDARGPQDATPLHLAAFKGRSGTVELLLREGAAVNAQTGSLGFTPIFLAAQMGHSRVVSSLIGANASLELRAHDGATPLHVAVSEGHDSVVKLLVAAGAFVDSANNAGERPIHAAQAMKHAAVAQMLLDAGATPVAQDDPTVEKMRNRPSVRVEIRPFLRSVGV